MYKYPFRSSLYRGQPKNRESRRKLFRLCEVSRRIEGEKKNVFANLAKSIGAMKSALESSENAKKRNKNCYDKKIHDNGKMVKFRCDLASSTQANVMLARGWIQVTEPIDQNWDLWWCERSEVLNVLNMKLLPRQKIPHFRNHHQLTLKNYLWRNLKRYRKLLIKAGKHGEAELANSMPITFELPNEYRMLVEEYHRQGGGTWIVKPAGGSQGRGIFLFRRLKDLKDWRTRESAKRLSNRDNDNSLPETFVVQKYLEDPYLVAGRKFDLRIYVLVTSFRPLKVWLAREGFARLSGVLFSLDRIDDSRIHLTNMSIQLKVEDGRRQTSVDDRRMEVATNVGDSLNDISVAKRGRKWSLIRVREFLTARHGGQTVETLFQRVAGIIMASLQAVQSVMMHSTNSFELYGYDIIIDENLRPWLLEVNASPALTPTDDIDHRLKYDMLEDVLNILDFEGMLTGRENRVGGFDLLWDMGPIWKSCPNSLLASGDIPRELRKLNIFLGTRNDREDQLKRMHEDLAAKWKSSWTNSKFTKS